MNGPRWIKQWIADLALLNEQFRDDEGCIDFEALGREEYMFRTALITLKFEKSARARETYAKAKAAYDASSENGKKGGRPRKQETTADASEGDGEVNPDGQQATQAESGTSANHYGPRQTEDRQSRRTGADSLRSDCHSAPVRSLPMPSKEQLYDFARAESLDEADARDWYEMTVVDRSGNDREGKPITNWKAALKRFCKSRADRRTA